MKSMTVELFNIAGKVAVITGGAKDLGFDMALALAQAGANVVITSRSLENARKASKKIKKMAKVDTLGIALDHCDWKQVESFAREVHQWKGYIDIIVNNAGGGSGKSEGNLFRRSIEDIANLIRTNLLGPIFCCKAIGPYMIKRRRGKIINIASKASVFGIFGKGYI